jgi:hypothetical protein
VDFDPEGARLGVAEGADAVGVGADELLACGAVSAGAELAVAWPAGAAGEAGEAAAVEQAHGAPAERGRDDAGALDGVAAGQEPEEAVPPGDPEVEFPGDGDLDAGPCLRGTCAEGVPECVGVCVLSVVDADGDAGISEGNVMPTCGG